MRTKSETVPLSAVPLDLERVLICSPWVLTRRHFSSHLGKKTLFVPAQSQMIFHLGWQPRVMTQTLTPSWLLPWQADFFLQANRVTPANRSVGKGGGGERGEIRNSWGPRKGRSLHQAMGRLFTRVHPKQNCTNRRQPEPHYERGRSPAKCNTATPRSPTQCRTQNLPCVVTFSGGWSWQGKMVDGALP